ncbi:NifB/NifX family molybdenum-iron cluster-binding protein [Haloferula sp. A504]|uniref:NifB/NifX family molybdenum-iron cluster-binding protein n=1 Tax=Haloferula sp. A504 TaxID=3373601 RepID=UPI0031C15203|nr:NifB/NifX family molybdenum-iron cluster-binding protein [Verrucomicrobiaceae bacterium E54]
MNNQQPSIGKVAVATQDGRLSAHFRSSHAFALFHGRSRHPSALYRVNTRPDDGGTRSHEAHHRQIAALLEDCTVLICGGIGDHAAAQLEERGIRVVVAKTGGTPEAVYQAFCEGSLPLGEVHRCCHGGH